MHDLGTNEDRVTRVVDMANAMLTTGHFEADKIRKRLAEIQQLWAELNEVAKARQEVRPSAWLVGEGGGGGGCGGGCYR